MKLRHGALLVSGLAVVAVITTAIADSMKKRSPASLLSRPEMKLLVPQDPLKQTVNFEVLDKEKYENLFVSEQQKLQYKFMTGNRDLTTYQLYLSSAKSEDDESDD